MATKKTAKKATSRKASKAGAKKNGTASSANGAVRAAPNEKDEFLSLFEVFEKAQLQEQEAEELLRLAKEASSEAIKAIYEKSGGKLRFAISATTAPDWPYRREYRFGRMQGTFFAKKPPKESAFTTL